MYQNIEKIRESVKGFIKDRTDAVEYPTTGDFPAPTACKVVYCSEDCELYVGDGAEWVKINS